MIIFLYHFSFALFPLIGLCNPFTYSLNSGFSSSDPRELKSGTVEDFRSETVGSTYSTTESASLMLFP